MRLILIAAMLILAACTPHMIVKPPAVTVAPGIAPATNEPSLMPTITPDLRTVTP